MDQSCEIVRRALREAEGDPCLLSEEELQHLATCRECAAEAAAERRLYRLLAAAVPAADPFLQRHILERAAVHSRKRALALAPVAAGALLIGGGVAILGGLPGAGFLVLAPGVTFGAGLSVAGGVEGVVAAAGTALEAIHSVLPPATALMASGAAALGAGLLGFGARRLARRVG